MSTLGFIGINCKSVGNLISEGSEPVPRQVQYLGHVIVTLLSPAGYLGIPSQSGLLGWAHTYIIYIYTYKYIEREIC